MGVPSLVESLGAFLFAAPAVVWTASRMIPCSAGVRGPPIEFTLATAVILTLSAHEGVHAALYWLSGSGVRFGVGAHYLYVAATRPVTRETFLLVSVGPLALISASTLAAARAFPTRAELPAAIFALNALGSSGDVVLAVKTLGAPRGSLVMDRGDRSVVIPPCGRTEPPGWWASVDAFLKIYPLALTLVGTLALLTGGAPLEFHRCSGSQLIVNVDPTAPSAAALISAAAALAAAARSGGVG